MARSAPRAPRGVHLDTTTGARAVPGSQHDTNCRPTAMCGRTRCEPGTARAPVHCGLSGFWWRCQDALRREAEAALDLTISRSPIGLLKMGGTSTQFSLGFVGRRKLFRLQSPTIIAVLLQCFGAQADTLSSDE